MVKSILLLLYNRLKLLAMITSLSKRTRTFEGSGCGFCWQMAFSLTWKNSLSCASSSELIGQSAALLNIASFKQGSGNRPVRCRLRLQVMTSINSACCRCQNTNIRLLNKFPSTYFSAFWHQAPLHLLLCLGWLPSKIPTLIVEPLHTFVPTAVAAWQPKSQDTRLLHLNARECKPLSPYAALVCCQTLASDSGSNNQSRLCVDVAKFMLRVVKRSLKTLSSDSSCVVSECTRSFCCRSIYSCCHHGKLPGISMHVSVLFHCRCENLARCTMFAPTGLERIRYPA